MTVNTTPVLRRAARLFGVAVALNFVWEMAQMTLYVPGAPWLQQTIACARASIGDGGMLLIIYAAGALTLRRPDWYYSPGWRGYASMTATGVLVALVFETYALRSGRWAYTASMPTLPFLAGVGVVPILQMVVLPPIIFGAASISERRT